MYESILSNTLDVLKSLIFPIPAQGGIAGSGLKCGNIEWAREMGRSDNHHYPMGTAYLKMGVRGVAEKAAASAKKTESPEKRELLEGISKVYDEIGNSLARYAEEVYANAGDDQRLLRIADNLKALSQRAPVHFDEALQLVALMWYLRTLSCGGADIGRLDVHLKPYFENDISNGYLTENDVRELLCDFWLLINQKCGGDTLNNVMVGGMNPDGSDAGSRLSVLMLEATQKCAMSEPHINVRVHPNLNPDIYHAMLKVQLMGQGQATAYNDEVVIPGLIKFGIPEKLAYSYTNDGCTEIMLDGYSGIDFAHMDAVGVFELAFNNGNWAPRTYRKPVKYWHKNNAERFYTPEVVPGIPTGRVEDCETFDEFYKQFLRQYEFQTRYKANGLKRREDDRRVNIVTSLLLNGTYDYILDSGKDIQRGGFPVTAYMLFSGSIPTVADCLVSIKKLVYEQKKYTVSQIKEAIRVNFDGYEMMRQEMASMPKFGNDIDEVDLIAADIASHFCQWLDDFRNETGFAIMPALIGWRFLEEAYGVAATPDGRRYTDPIAEHYCATPGKASKGPTAHINSIAKAKDAIARSVGVCAVHITLPSNFGNTEKSLMILDSLVKSAFAQGLNQMNIAIYDAELLKKAQKDPENHKDIIVRVWGYSAQFVGLCKEMQDHVISRVAAKLT
ncbi:MAG: hypothetical protein IJW55_01345 [Clostridia bacterium]|nr:hypothetical protein [Clostridia bacterium]